MSEFLCKYEPAKSADDISLSFAFTIYAKLLSIIDSVPEQMVTVEMSPSYVLLFQ